MTSIATLRMVLAESLILKIFYSQILSKKGNNTSVRYEKGKGIICVSLPKIFNSHGVKLFEP